MELINGKKGARLLLQMPFGFFFYVGHGRSMSLYIMYLKNYFQLHTHKNGLQLLES